MRKSRKRKRYDGDRITDIYVDGSIVYNIISYKKGFKAAGLNYPTKCWCPHILTTQASNFESYEDNYIVKIVRYGLSLRSLGLFDVLRRA